MFPADVHYYRDRAQEERDRAAACTDEYAAEVHGKLAALYEGLITHEEPRRPTLSIVCRGH
jgi:hypothetical protein